MLAKDASLRDSLTAPANSTAGHTEESSSSKGFSHNNSQTTSHESQDGSSQTPSNRISQLLKGKEKEWTAVASKKGPLKLLDLPLDILRDILKEVA